MMMLSPRSPRTYTRCPSTTLFRSIRTEGAFPSCVDLPDGATPCQRLVAVRRGLRLFAPSFRHNADKRRRIRACRPTPRSRSEEQTSELAALMPIPYASPLLEKQTRTPFDHDYQQLCTYKAYN